MTGAVGWELCVGPVPVEEARERYRQAVLASGDDPTLESLAAMFFAVFDGMAGRFREAEEKLTRARAELVDLGLNIWVAAAGPLGWPSCGPGWRHSHVRAAAASCPYDLRTDT